MLHDLKGESKPPICPPLADKIQRGHTDPKKVLFVVVKKKKKKSGICYFIQGCIQSCGLLLFRKIWYMPAISAIGCGQIPPIFKAGLIRNLDESQ